jgi:hypothetical protein
MLKSISTASVFTFALLSTSCLSEGHEPDQPSSEAQQLSDGKLFTLSANEYLRQLSLDLTGRLPRVEVIDATGIVEAVPDSAIDRMLASEEFLKQVDVWHSELLWPNLERYEVSAVELIASNVRADPPDPISAPLLPYLKNHNWTGLRVASPDPYLVLDETARQDMTVFVEREAFRGALRGTYHAYSGGVCDRSPEAEYPDPSVVGTPANRYVVPAARSGTNRAYTALYYSEEAATRGLVLPIRDYLHCPNYCRRLAPVACKNESFDDRVNLGLTGGCFTPMDSPGDDPSGRHELDTPGHKCPTGYEREINSCDFSKVGQEVFNPAFTIEGLRIPMRIPQRPYGYFGAKKTVIGHQVEGWRWMKHYWSRGTPIRTCALEAQERQFGLINKYPDTGDPVECSKAVSGLRSGLIYDPSCGCGPQGAYCMPISRLHRDVDDSRTTELLRTSIEREPLEIIRSVVQRNEDYATILSTTRSFVNGPLAFAWKYQGNVLHGEGFLGVSAPEGSNPVWDATDYAENKWKEYTRSTRHSGVLTTLEFLQRFPTYRARIAQYRRAFLCSAEFDYAPQPDPEDANPDIAARSGCSSCHNRLENDGMYFGRYLDRQPTYVPQQGSRAARANDHPMFKEIFRFRDPSHFSRLDEGPAAMVARDLASDDRFERCTVKRAFDRLVRRPPEEAELQQLTDEFRQSGRKYRELIRRIVTSDAYKKVYQ